MPDKPTEPRTVRIEFYSVTGRNPYVVKGTVLGRPDVIAIKRVGHHTSAFSLSDGYEIGYHAYRIHLDDLKELQAEYAAKQEDSEAVRLLRAFVAPLFTNYPLTSMQATAAREARAYLAALDAGEEKP